MMVLGIILGVILLILAMIGVGVSIQEKGRRQRCKSWKIGDKLVLNRGDYHRELEKNKVDYAILKGWSLDSLYINCGDDFVHKVSWGCLNYNKDDNWRQNYEEAKKVMGCDPAFPNGVGTSSTSKGNIDGKPIETMSEIECEVQLKLAIENEDYTLADNLRKRLERFR
jgi:hypothetical protein